MNAMTWAQFFSDHLWDLVIIAWIFHKGFVTFVHKLAEPFLEHRLQIEKERTRQAELDHKIAKKQVEAPKKYQPYQQGYPMEQEQE